MCDINYCVWASKLRYALTSVMPKIRPGPNIFTISRNMCICANGRKLNVMVILGRWAKPDL